MRCADVREWLATPDGDRPGDVESHLDTCSACAVYAARTTRVDALARPMLLVEPPAELQLQLMELVRTSHVPVLAPGPAPSGDPRLFGWGAGIAAMLAAVAGWRVYGVVESSSIVIGNVAEAAQVLVASPATRYLVDLPLADVPSLAMWAGVAAVAWSVSPSGPLRDFAARLGLPA